MLALALSATLAALAFTQPTSPESFRRYLVGEWTVRKAINYKSGGISGHFDGAASFRLVDAKAPSFWGLVLYSENGLFSPKSNDFQARETRNRLLYDFSSSEKADVYSANAADESSSAAEIRAQSTYLYSLQPGDAGSLVIEQHADGDDEYKGQIEVEAPNAFISTWGVSGPQQDGEIASLFKRVDPLDDVQVVQGRRD